MGGETHPIPSHGSKRRSNPIPWVKNFLQSVPWDAMGLSHPMRSPGIHILNWLDATGNDMIVPNSFTSRRSDSIIDFGIAHDASG